ncbi:MAG: hypothetical protein KF765_01740 [Parvibaculaceae bacterium]|nr:hypothetical protein [Parvibaculaceae bacterium]
MQVWRMMRGYLAACAAAAITVSILTAIVIAATESDSQIILAIVAMLIGVPMSFAITLIAAMPGAIVIVVIARIAGFSSWTYYVTGGILNALLVVIRIAISSDNGVLSVTDMSTYISLVPATLMGFVAGLTYWHVAVRERGTASGEAPKSGGWGTA